jgi:hypothetical protein
VTTHTSDLDHALFAALRESDEVGFYVIARAVDGSPSRFMVSVRRGFWLLNAFNDDRLAALNEAMDRLRASGGAR